MKRFAIFSLSAAAVAFGSFAQSKFDMPAALMLGNAEIAAAPASRSGDFTAIEPEVTIDQEVVLLVTLADGATSDGLVAAGFNVINERAGIALLTTTPARMRELADRSDVKQISMGYDNQKHLSHARIATGVDDAQKGVGLDKAYNGEGVIVGLMDTGLDINHINFRNADGSTRVERLWVITGNTGAMAEYDTPEKIESYTTDDPKETHGTHVLGLMAGSYNGHDDKNGQFAYTNKLGGVGVSRTLDFDTYGVATKAAIAACAGSLQGNNIMLAAEKIHAYAKDQGKPAVMNLSLGHNVGPHDGTTASNKYLAELGKEMIIVISAGNEGGEPLSLEKTFTADSKEVKTFISESGSMNQGVADIWSSDDKPFTVKFGAVDKNTGEVIFSYTADQFTPVTDKGELQNVYVTGNAYTAADYLHPEGFDKTFGGKAAMIYRAAVDGNNNRYQFYAQFQQLAAGNDAYPAIFIEGTPGQTINMYTAGNVRYYSNKMEGYTAGDDKMSISDMACGDNVIAVGAYVNRTTWPTINSDVIGYNTAIAGKEGSIAFFSSYGKNGKGEPLPHIAGPGMGIISSYSHYYCTGGADADGYDDSNEPKYTAARLAEPKRVNYWKEMMGTSMSAPFTAGVVALWLQAEPTLNIDEVKALMKETAINDEFTAKSPERWGWGKINAIGGLHALGKTSGVAGVTADASAITINTTGSKSFTVLAAGAAEVKAHLYTTSGVMVASVAADGDSATLNAENAAPGLYILSAEADGRTETRKVVLQ